MRLWLMLMLRIEAAGLMIACALCVALWLTGRIVSDRYGWSQWLLWIPTPVTLLACVVGVTVALAWRGRGKLLWTWCGAFAAVLIYFSFIEYRLVLPIRAAEDEGLLIVHWNPTAVQRRLFDEHAEAVVAVDGDITVLTDAFAMPFRQSVRDWLGEDARPIPMRPFTILTRVPIVQRRMLVAEDGIFVALITFDTTESLGRPLVMYAVDMPSDLDLGRYELALRTRRMIDNADAPEPDIIVGDFNITRNAASLRTMFPDHHHAYNKAGRGYAATFRRDWPLYHIDHILLSDAIRAARYQVIDPGSGRHRIQTVRITANE